MSSSNRSQDGPSRATGRAPAAPKKKATPRKKKAATKKAAVKKITTKKATTKKTTTKKTAVTTAAARKKTAAGKKAAARKKTGAARKTKAPGTATARSTARKKSTTKKTARRTAATRGATSDRTTGGPSSRDVSSPEGPPQRAADAGRNDAPEVHRFGASAPNRDHNGTSVPTPDATLMDRLRKIGRSLAAAFKDPSNLKDT